MKGDIDVVYVWCGEPATKFCRFTKDIDYSVQSVHKFMPWTRKIWVVVSDDFDKPELLPKGVCIVKESKIVPKRFLPVTWNSNVIESWIWAIPGLSDKFIYFCDDMYVGRVCEPADFFVGDMPILRVYD